MWHREDRGIAFVGLFGVTTTLAEAPFPRACHGLVIVLERIAIPATASPPRATKRRPSAPLEVLPDRSASTFTPAQQAHDATRIPAPAANQASEQGQDRTERRTRALEQVNHRPEHLPTWRRVRSHEFQRATDPIAWRRYFCARICELARLPIAPCSRRLTFRPVVVQRVSSRR